MRSSSFYGCMTFPMDLYIPRNSPLIGKSAKEVLTSFGLDTISTYVLDRKAGKRKNLKPMDPESKFEARTNILCTGTLGIIKDFKKEYHLWRVN